MIIIQNKGKITCPSAFNNCGSEILEDDGLLDNWFPPG